MQSQDTFAFITICDTLADLQHYLANEWSDAFLEDLVAMQIESMMRAPTSDTEIILKEIVDCVFIYNDIVSAIALHGDYAVVLDRQVWLLMN